MKILLISHSSNLYGAERSLLDLAEGLVRSGHDIVALCPDDGPLPNELGKLAIPVHYMPFTGIGKGSIMEVLLFSALFFPSVLRLNRWMRKSKFDVVYNNTLNAVWGPLAAKISGTRLFWHIREVKPQMLFLRKIGGVVIQMMASEAIFNSHAAMKAFRHHPPLSWHVVYNGVDVKADYERRKNGLPFVMGYAGQMAHHKRPERFLYALCQVKKQAPGVKGIMVGDGPRLPMLRLLAKELEVADDVVFTGYLDSLDAFYAGIDVLVLTSDRESFGRVVVEAMSRGRAVIAAAVGGVPEVVEDGKTGYLVPANDIAAYAEKVLDFVNRPEFCYQMGAAGHQRVSELFSKSRYQQVLIRILTAAPETR